MLRLFDEDGDFPGDDDAHCTLTYSVIDRSDMTHTDLATFAIDQFEASTAPSMWPALVKAQIIADLRQRRWNPANISPQNSNFCGPTSIIFELASTQPRRYVDRCRQLFETGGFCSRTHRVNAPVGLHGSRADQTMRPADWMMISTMRQNENAVFGVSPTAGGLQSMVEGMTTL